MAQQIKNVPAVWETWVQSLGWEGPLEKGKATHSSVLAWRSVTKSWTQLSEFHFSLCMKYSFDISNFLEVIAGLFHSIAVLYFFALFSKECLLISPCYSLEFCIRLGTSFPFSLAFYFSLSLFFFFFFFFFF